MSEQKKRKKRFYKKWWFWLLVVIIIIAIGSGMGNKKSDNNKSNSTSSSKKVTKKSGITREKYEKITMGETKDELTKSLGKPNSTTSTDINGQKDETLTWTNLSSDFKVGSVTATVNDNKVNGKGYLNASLDKLKPLDKSKLDSIQNGVTYSDVINKLGQPDSETYTDFGGMKSILIVYLTSKNGDAQSFTFTNNSLTSKTETHIN